ncbi:hypothetical protein PS910_04371 [Pseudomonas fluorescens]|nr:hypothetical protein PS910_04371 [Pseudomonas fluorescens]
MELTEKSEAVQGRATPTTMPATQKAWKRALGDWLSTPVFIGWSAIISFFIEFSTDENINHFFVNLLGEGIALKSIITLFVIALLPSGLALVRPPAPGGKWEEVLCAPTRLGRSMSITTMAFMLGTLPAYWYSSGLATAVNGLAPLIGAVLAMWLVLFAQDSLIVNASKLRSGSETTLFSILGKCLIAGCVVGSVLLYFQILDGDYKTEAVPVEVPATTG